MPKILNSCYKYEVIKNGESFKYFQKKEIKKDYNISLWIIDQIINNKISDDVRKLHLIINKIREPILNIKTFRLDFM